MPLAVRRAVLLGCLACGLALGGVAMRAQEEPDEPAAVEVLPVVQRGVGLAVVEGRQVPLELAETAAGPLFAAGPLLRELGGGLRPGPAGAATVLMLGGVTAIAGVGRPVVTIGQEIVQLPQGPQLSGAELLVPLELLRRLFGEARGLEVVWQAADRRLVVSRPTGGDVGVAASLVHLQGLSTLVLTPAEPVPYRVVEGRGRLRVELQGGRRPVPLDPGFAPDDPLVRGLAYRGSEIVVDLAPGAVADHYEQPAPFRLVFDVYRQRAAAPEPAADPLPGASAAYRQPLIFIDPGHGGAETGALGSAGAAEKDLTLELSRRLARRLEARLPVRAELTRDEDADLPLDTRTALANEHRADLFVSIHLNSSPRRGASGAETYFLSLEASDAAAAAAARAENRGAGPTSAAGGDLELILWDLAQSRHLAESQRFATLVQGELNEALGLRDRGVKQAPFRVLMGAAMPAVLVELGFLSNPAEEERLRDAEYQEQLVTALVDAVGAYLGGGDASLAAEGGDEASRPF